MLVNFLCLLCLMVLTEGYTISKNIASDSNNNDKFDNIRDIEYNEEKRNLHSHHKCISDGKHVTTPEQSQRTMPNVKTMKLVSKIPENNNVKNGFFRKIKNKFIGKAKPKTIKKVRNVKKKEYNEHNYENFFKISDINNVENLNNNNVGATDDFMLNNDFDAIDGHLKRKRSFGETIAANNKVDLKLNDNYFNSDARDLKFRLLNTNFDKVKEIADFNEMKNQLSDVTTKIGHLKNLYGLDKITSTVPYSQKMVTYNYNLGSGGFKEIFQIESLLNNMKNRAFQTVIEQSPEITEAVTNVVTEVTFESDPYLNHLNIQFPKFKTFNSVNGIEKVNRKYREAISLPAAETVFSNEREELNKIKKRSMKEEAASKAYTIEHELQKKLRKTCKKVKEDLYKEIKQLKSTLHWDTAKPAATPPNGRKDSNYNKDHKDTKAKVTSEKTDVKVHPKKVTSPKVLHKTPKFRRNKTFDILPSLKFTTPYDDDLVMLTLFEKTLSKIREDNIRKMLITTTGPQKRLYVRNFKPRNNELNFGEDSVKFSEGDSPDIVMSYNDDLEEKSVTANDETDDISFEGLSSKIAYNDYVNGYKHYLKFQKEFGKDKFSNQVRFQAHMHHSVDDIGKFILKKIPQISTSRYKRKFFDDTDADDQDLSTKSDESWFKRHFYFFIDNGQPKKYHTAQTVTVKSPVVTEANVSKATKIKLEDNSTLNTDGIQKTNDESNRISDAEVQEFTKPLTDSNHVSLTSESFRQTSPEVTTEKHGLLNINLKRRLKNIRNRNSKARYKRRELDEVLKIDNDYNRKKIGYVQLNSAPTQTAVVKLENTAKTSKIKSFLNGRRFRKRKNKNNNKNEKSRQKRNLERNRRFNVLKMLKNSISFSSNNNSSNNKNTEMGFATHDYDLLISHIDTFTPVPFKKKILPPFNGLRNELQHQVPNITDIDLSDSSVVMNEEMQENNFAISKNKINQNEGNLLGYKFTPDITSPRNDFNVVKKVRPSNNFKLVKEVTPSFDFNVVKEGTPSYDFNVVKEGTPTNNFNVVKEVTPSYDFNLVKEVTPSNVFNVVKEVTPSYDFNVVKEGTPTNNFNVVKEVTPSYDFNLVKEVTPSNVFNVVKELTPSDNSNVVKEVNIKLIKVSGETTPNKIVSTTLSYLNDLIDSVNDLKSLTLNDAYGDYIQNSYITSFDSFENTCKTTEEKDYFEGHPSMKIIIDKRANRTANNDYYMYETSTNSLARNEMFNSPNSNLSSAPTHEINIDELLNKKSTAKLIKKNNNDALFFNKKYTPKHTFQFHNDKLFERLNAKSTLRGLDEINDKELLREFNKKSSNKIMNEIGDDNLFYNWRKETNTVDDKNEINNDELLKKINENSAVRVSSDINSAAERRKELPLSSTIADYFNDFLIWNNDILESKKLVSQDILKNVSTIKQYSDDLNLLRYRCIEVDKFMKGSKYHALDKKPQYNIKVGDNINTSGVKASDLKIKNEEENLNRHVQSNVVIDYLNKMNKSEERHKCGVKKFMGLDTKDIATDNYEKSKATDATDLLIDNTLMSYDDELEYFTSKIKKDLPKQTDKKHSKSNRTIAAKIKNGKKNTPPKQYYSTPMPMENKVFEKFLKENQMDVATVTSPMVMSTIANMTKFLISSRRTSTAKPNNQKVSATKEDKPRRDSYMSKDVQAKKVEYEPEYEMQYLNQLENSLYTDLDFEDENDFEETNGRFKSNEAPIDEVEVRIVKRGLNLFSKKTTVANESGESKSNKEHESDVPVTTNDNLKGDVEVTIINFPDTNATTVHRVVSENKETIATNNSIDDDFGYNGAELEKSYFHMPTLSQFSKIFFKLTTKAKTENLTTAESIAENTTEKLTTNKEATELAHTKTDKVSSSHNETKIIEKGGYNHKSYIDEIYNIMPSINKDITRVKISSQCIQHKTFFTRLPSPIDENNSFVVVTAPDMKRDTTSMPPHVTLPASEIFGMIEAVNVVRAVDVYIKQLASNIIAPQSKNIRSDHVPIHIFANRKGEVKTTRKDTLTSINQVFKNDKDDATCRLVTNNTIYESRNKRKSEDFDSSEIHTAKQVAALEVIVDLMRDKKSLVNNNINTHNVDVQKYIVGDSSVESSTKRNVELESMTKRMEPINNIQIHIAVPYNVCDRKRSVPNTNNIRKIFSANFSNPVDLEYQIHSFKETTTEETRTLSTGIYLVVQNGGVMIPKGKFTLQPHLVENSSKVSRASFGKDSRKISERISSKVTLSNNLVSELLQLYKNLNNTAQQNAKVKKFSKPKHNIVKQLFNNMKSKQSKRNAKWNIFAKYFGDERVCNCKCKENHTMCKACVASDKVMSELIFEFNNLAKYMSDHCTEIQTFFYMNPSGGRKLKEVVHRIDRSLNNYYKRVKGKCQGATCNMLCTCMNKRDTTSDTNPKEYKGYPLLTDIERIANNLYTVSKTKDCFDLDLFKAINNFKNVTSFCIPLSRTVKDTRRAMLLKNVYSADNVKVNLMCNAENSTHNAPVIENYMQSSDDFINKNLLQTTAFEEMNTESIQQYIDGFGVEGEPNYSKYKRKYKKKRKPKKIKPNYIKNFKRDIDSLKTNANQTQTLVNDTCKITTQFIQNFDSEAHRPLSSDNTTVANTVAPNDISNLSKETNSDEHINEVETETEMSIDEKNIIELKDNVTKLLDSFDRISKDNTLEHTKASNFDNIFIEEKPVETKKKAKKKKKKLKNLFKHKKQKKIHKEEKIKESSKDQASTIPEIPSPTLDTNDSFPSEPDMKSKNKSVEILTSPLDSESPTVSTPPKAITDKEVSTTKEQNKMPEPTTNKFTPCRKSTVRGFFNTVMDFIHKLDKGNFVVDEKNASTLRDNIFRIKVPIYDNRFIVSLESKNDNEYIPQIVEHVTSDNIEDEKFMRTVTFQSDNTDKEEIENNIKDYESNKITMTRSVSGEGKGRSPQRDLLLSILKFETCEIKDELEKITDLKNSDNLSSNLHNDTLDSVNRTEEKMEEPLKSLLGKVLNKFGIKYNQELGKNNSVQFPTEIIETHLTIILYLATNKENHSPKIRCDEKNSKNLTEAGEVEGKPSGVCDLDATIQHVIEEHRRLSSKDFQNYVKNIHCARSKRIPEYFLIQSKKTSKKRRKTHKSSKYRKNRDGIRHRSLLSLDVNFYVGANEFEVENENNPDNSNNDKHKVIYNENEDIDTYTVENFKDLNNKITRNEFDSIKTLLKQYKPKNSDNDYTNTKQTRCCLEDSKTYEYTITSAPKLEVLFEIFKKDSDGIYRINNRRKRDAGSIPLTSKQYELPPLDAVKDEIHVVLNDSIIIHCNPRGEDDTKYTWLTDRGDIRDYNNVIVNGPTLCIEGVKADNVGHYECRAYGELERSVKLSVLDVPKYYVIFTPTYNGLQDCTYEDFKVLRYLGHEISELMCNGNHYCNVKVEEPTCLIDEDEKTAQVRTTVVITSHHSELRCSPQCRRDLEFSIALLSAGNAPPLSSIPVVISNEGVNKTLRPSVKFDQNVFSNTIIKTSFKRGIKKREDYHEITSKMSPKDVAILVSCQGGFYLVSNQMICATCPENTYSTEGDNVCRPCPKSGYSAPGSKKCHKIYRLHRYDWLYPPLAQCVVGCCAFICCTYTICIMFSHLTRDPTDGEPPNEVTDDDAFPGTSRNVVNHARARPISPSRLILSKLFRRASSFHIESESQETKLGLWKEKNAPPPLPPVDFDLISE